MQESCYMSFEEAMKNAFLERSITEIDNALIEKCGVKLRHPEDLSDALIEIGKDYHETIEAMGF